MDSHPKKYCNSKHEKYIGRTLHNMRKEKDFCDVTLACGDEQLLAHKVILSALSPLFNSILKQHFHPHPIIYITGANYRSLQQVLDFMYLGQVQVPPLDVESFEALADQLQVQQINKNDPEQKESDDNKDNGESDDKDNKSDDDKDGGDYNANKSDFDKEKDNVSNRGNEKKHKEGAPHEEGDRSKKEGIRPSEIKTNGPILQLKRSHSKESQNKTKFSCPDTTEGTLTRDRRAHDDSKDVENYEKLEGSIDPIRANPGGPGGQRQAGGASGGPRQPGGPPSLEEEFNNNVEFSSPPTRFGVRDEFYGGPGGQDEFISGQEGRGRRRGVFEETQDLDEQYGVFRRRGGHDRPGIETNAPQEDTDVINDQDNVSDNEDLEVNVQNDEDAHSTISSQSNSSIPRSSDVETIESYGDAKEEIERFTKFVANNVEENGDTVMCKLCLREFPRRWNAERHLKTIHFGEEKVCRQCGQLFRHQESLAKHHRSGKCANDYK